MKEIATFEIVCQAADKLESFGDEATTIKVMKHLGFGSPNTIQKHLENRKSAIAMSNHKPIPQEIKSAHENSLILIWARLSDEATKDINILRGALDTEKNRHIKEEQELLSEIERLSNLNYLSDQENSSLAAENRRLLIEIASANGVTSYQAAEIASLSKQIESMREEIIRLRLSKNDTTETKSPAEAASSKNDFDSLIYPIPIESDDVIYGLSQMITL